LNSALSEGVFSQTHDARHDVVRCLAAVVVVVQVVLTKDVILTTNASSVIETFCCRERVACVQMLVVGFYFTLRQ